MELTASLGASGAEEFSARIDVVVPLPDGRGSVGGFIRPDRQPPQAFAYFLRGYQEVSDGEGWTLFLQPEVLLQELNNVSEAPICECRFSAVDLYGNFGADAERWERLSVVGDSDQFEDGSFLGIGSGASGDAGEAAGVFFFSARSDDEVAGEFGGFTGSFAFAECTKQVAHTFFLNQQFHVPWSLFVHHIEEVITGSHGAIFEHLSELGVGYASFRGSEDAKFFVAAFFECAELVAGDGAITFKSSEFDEQSLAIGLGISGGFRIPGSLLAADHIDFFVFA